MFDIEKNLKKLPDSPGVYIHKDKLGNVIYVGKAISLRRRVRQYFRISGNSDPKVRAMVSNIAEFEYITAGNEMEALILECNLIKRYMPRYNVLLKDDKTYPFIKITAEEFPRIIKTRTVKKDGGRYFGPYSDAGAVNQMVELLNSTYRLKRCSRQTFPGNFRPCLNYHISQCDGICRNNSSREAYMERIDSASDFLKGRNREIADYLREKMETASVQMKYEEAARYRDYLAAAQELHKKQRVVLKDTRDIDVVLAAGREHIVLFYVRDGKLTGRENYNMQAENEEKEADVTEAFLKQHYGRQQSGPAEILVSQEMDELSLIEEYLSGIWPRKVKIHTPEKGEKKALLEMTQRDAAEMSRTIEDREKDRRERERSLGSEIHGLLRRMGAGDDTQYSGQEYRVEAYDISNTNGVETVGAMAVFRGLRPEKKSYRRFRVRTAESSDDYGSMQEILYRRFKRALEDDPGFSELPHIVLIDGGRGHVAAAAEVLDAMGISVPAAGMVKDDRHRTRGLVYQKNGGYEEEDLRKDPLLFRYLGTIQEEVHRFAIEYHRGVRDKKAIGSVLDEIDGIGPARRNALLEHFGSIENIKKADADELKKINGITGKTAKNIREYFD